MGFSLEVRILERRFEVGDEYKVADGVVRGLF